MKGNPMAHTAYSTFTSDDLDIEFVAEYDRRFDDVPPDVQVLSLHILGVKVAFHHLPKDLQSAILSLQPETV
jgi:hypothetical protein